MSAEVKAPKYPILDDIEIPEKVIENWQVTADLLAEFANVPAALIMRVHAHEIEVFVSSHSPGNVYHHGEKAPLDMGLYCETVMSTQRKQLVPNALKDPDWDHNPDIKPGMISYCGLPLTWPNGEIFGTICVLDKKENVFNHRIHPLMGRLRDSIHLSLESIYNASEERKQAEEKLQAVSAYTRSLIEASLDPLVTINAEGKITDVNLATEQIAGRVRGELIGTDFSDYFTEPDKAREGYQQVFSQGFVRDYPLAIRHRSGQVTGVFAVARDITAAKLL